MTGPASVLGRVRTRCSREEWNLGVVPQRAEDIVRHGITTTVRWLPAPGPWHMFADPACCVLPDGTRVVMAEYLHQWNGRGEVWKAEVPPGQALDQAQLRPWIRAGCHLSYPFPVRDEVGRLCLLTESWEASALHLWREEGGTLRLVGPILDRPVVDATPWHDGTRWWLFCTLHGDGANERLHLFHSDRLAGPWIPHPGNPVKIDAGSARPAGPLFHVDGRLVRPSQDCSRTYGGAVVLNAVTRLDPDGFEETPIRRLEPQPEYPHGLHTLCPAGDVTIIDGKRWAFQPLDLPRKFAAVASNRLRPLRRAVLPDQLTFPPAGRSAPSAGSGAEVNGQVQQPLASTA
ncbi:MAG: hypothetical protein AB7F35_18280 [Acetobacteraceae bacterium]